jgi:hypothetical protein
MSSASVPTRYACSGAQHQLSFSGRAQQPEPESSINGAIPTRRLEIVRIIAKRKAHLRRERLDDACDRCNPAELTRDENGGLEVYESLTRAGEYVHFRRFGACALNLKAP